MDHSHMDHSHMDHGDMGDMGDMPMPMCSMNMLFTWDTTNLCIVFSGWRITDTFSLIWSLLAVIALCAGYEAVREASRRYELRHAALLENMPPRVPAMPNLEGQNERSSLLGTIGSSVAVEEQRGKIIKAALYGVQVFYSFFIMLLFMTYNGWIMIAVGVGAFLGYLLFSNGPAAKTAACH